MSASEASGDLLRHIRQRRRNVTVALAAVAGAAAAVIALLISTHVVEVTVEPPDADAALERKQGVILTVGRRVLLYSSQGIVTVGAPGFFPRDVPVARADGKRRLAVLLDPRPGTISISVQSDEDFLIRVDGRVVGDDPQLNLELAAGTHSVDIQGPRIAPIQREIEVEGRGARQSFTFTPTIATDAPSVELRVAAVPSFARILVDGSPVGTGKFAGPLHPGVHEVGVEADDYAPERRLVDIPADATTRDMGTIVLTPRPARASITTTPAGATVLLNGDYRGDTPLQLELAPGREHRLSVRKTGFRHADELLNPLPNARIERFYHLTATTYRARITANLPAQIAVNGHSVGSSPLTVEVADDDEITASAEGFIAQPIRVRPGGEATRAYTFKLVEAAQFAYQSAAPVITAPAGIRMRRFGALRFDVRPGGSASPEPVELSRPFYFAVHETKVAAYRAFEPQFAPHLPPDIPAVDVTWQDAARFCNWLSAQAGLPAAYETGGAFPKLNPRSLGFRLPTEAEWEAVGRYDFAAGRVHARTHPWGGARSIPRAFANFAGRERRHAGAGPAGSTAFLPDHVDNHRDLAPVGSYPANINGIHDLWGNASEWVNDYYRAGPFQPERRVDPRGPHTGTDHVVRGANYTSGDRAALALGYRTFAANKSHTVGFRIARWIH